jgi:hypothetical protein
MEWLGKNIENFLGGKLDSTTFNPHDLKTETSACYALHYSCKKENNCQIDLIFCDTHRWSARVIIVIAIKIISSGTRGVNKFIAQSAAKVN